MPSPSNALNISDAGIPVFNGVDTFSATTTTQNSIQIGGASNTLSSLPLVANAILQTNPVGVPSLSQTLPSTVQGNITTVGTVTSGTWNGSTITVPFGGTGRATLTNHGVLVGAATSAITQLAAGSAGQVLQSGGASADPAYSTATYPSTAGTNLNVLTSDGTNWTSTAPAASSKTTTYNAGSTTWTKDARTKFICVMGWGAGGGGGSGRKGTTALSGGGGGGGKGGSFYYFGPASVFDSSESVVVGTGGAGGIAQTATADGNPGSAGSANTVFGKMIGVAGAGGGAGINGTTSNAAGGANVNNFNNPGSLSNGGTGAVSTGGTSNTVGGSGAANTTFSSTSGAGGGGANSVTERAGGVAGSITDVTGTNLVAGGTAGLESTGIAGGNGNPQLSIGGIITGGTGGGGGGGYSVGAGGATTGGRGGDGAVPGGGGGGGGGGISAVADSGAGGNGADGKIIVIEFF